ncbi:MAG: hypothetical protein AB8G86_20485 [Saprospiraceae bacterium]
MSEQEKKILSKFEWFLLSVAIGLLAVVLLQNNGIHAVETVEHTEITDAQEVSKKEVIRTQERSKELKELANYFAENRANAKKEGKNVGFNWNSLKVAKDEENYLKNKYGKAVAASPSSDWLSTITESYKTYKSVKITFEELGIDASKIINAENAAKALSNPVIANSVFKKIEADYGIPARKSRAFARKNQQNLEKWASFVEEQINQK